MTRKFRHVLKAFYGLDWAIMPEKIEQIQALLELRAEGLTLSQEEISNRIGMFEPPPEMSNGKVAVLNLYGTISHRMNAFQRYSGGTSAEMFQAAMQEAINDSNVESIVINVDSPGGSVPLVPETAELIYNARDEKRIITVVNPMMASAAIWIGTAAGEVVAIPSATDIGSIGVLRLHTDRTQEYQEKGIRHRAFRSSSHKYEGNDFEELSKDSAAHFQERVDEIHVEFVEAIAKHRNVSVKTVEANFGDGRTMRAQEALEVGLIDRIASLQDVLNELGAQSPDTNTQAANGRSRQRIHSMNPQIKLALVQAGLVAAIGTDAEFTAALNLHCDANKIDETNEAAVLASFETAAAPAPAAVATAASGSSVPETAAAAAGPVVAPAPAASGLSHSDIMATVQISGLPANTQLELIRDLSGQENVSLTQVRDRINQAQQDGQEAVGQTPPANVTVDSRDKFTTSARDAILTREFGGNAPEQVYQYQTGEYVDFTPNRRQVGLSNLLRLAEGCLIQCGVPHTQIAGLAPMQIAQLVMGGSPEQMGLGGFSLSADGAAYNVSGMFSNILLDAANVTLRRSYDDARTTFQQWMRQAPSIADFKTVNRVIAGELGDPKAIPENGEFEETTLTDGKESYKLTVWGQIFSMSWQLVVNDQLSSFVEIPGKMGRSMRRKQNKLAYGVVNDNNNLADSNALFDASNHTNRQTGTNADAAAIKAKWAAMATDMAEQTGLDSDSGALNLEPRFVVHPPALNDVIMTALNSSSLHANNPGVANTKRAAYEPIMDAQLGLAQGGSDTRYVLAADNNDVDTIEYAYLQGLEAPVIEQETSFSSLGMKRRIYQAFAVKAIDYRGLQDDTGV